MNTKSAYPSVTSLCRVGRPVHVRITHQCKTGAHALLDEGLRKNIVDMQFGFVRHNCTFDWLEESDDEYTR